MALQTVEFKWEIEDFYMCVQPGKFIESPKFTVYCSIGKVAQQVDWHVKLFPNGRTHEERDFISIYLKSSTKVQASCSFTLFNRVGEVDFIIENKNSKVEIFPSENSWGDAKFTRVESIKKCGTSDNRHIVSVVCRLTIIPQNEVSKLEHRDGYKKVRFSDRFEDLYESKKFSDVSLISEGKTVKAHKVILANGSAVFNTMFDADMMEKQRNTVVINDIKYDVLVELLRFIYCGRIHNIDELAFELAIAADKYAVDDLKEVCEETIAKNLNNGNAIACLKLSDKLNMDLLQRKALEFIVCNDVVSRQLEFKMLPSHILLKLFYASTEAIKKYKCT
ncbi:speckle-type POZ protein B-like [Nasonia vitripennis]|uniref:Uncharacterized protein n=1 Tax=Nasonia vitripennis TaxID=7425 RepID=A0A7M7R2V5_NASVI|nr:speckle-type POZ protein B-like [Nasonia vitripennis]